MSATLGCAVVSARHIEGVAMYDAIIDAGVGLPEGVLDGWSGRTVE